MGPFDQFRRRGASVSCWGGWLLAWLWLLGPVAGWAQAPAWSAATITGVPQMNGFSVTNATAVDASSNVFVTGTFTGQVTFGSTVLTSRGGNDLFVAKYVPGTSTWAWALSGGGTRYDVGASIAVSGTSVYVTGNVFNNTANANGVLLGGTGTTAGTVRQHGATSTASNDILVAKYIDNGSTATLSWTQVAGGTGSDGGGGIAVSGTSVYVTGNIFNNTANAHGVLFGGTGTATGTAQQHGATSTAGSDMIVAKYIDNGSTATMGWTQVGGGTSTDTGCGVAVSGMSVYVTGYTSNDIANSNGVLFGGMGTVTGSIQQLGASSTTSADLVVAKYTDSGSTVTMAWTQVGGGTGGDFGQGIAVSGTSVYVTGEISNDTGNNARVLFGGTGTTAGTVQQSGATTTAGSDIIVAKYIDNGSTATVGWTQVAGGMSNDFSYGIAVSSTSVYVAGSIFNNTANANGVLFGGTGTTAGTVQQSGATTTAGSDIIVANYIDNGGTATVGWTQVAGGSNLDGSQGITVSGTSVYVVGYFFLEAMFGSMTLSSPGGTVAGFLAQLATNPLPTRQPTAARLALYPNPAHTSVRVQVPDEARAPLQLFDGLGRVVRTQPAPAVAGTARELPLLGLPAGLYVLRCGAQAQRLVVE